MTRLLAIASLALAACGGGHSAPVRPDRPVGHGAVGGPAAQLPSVQECEALIAHAIALGGADRPDGKTSDLDPEQIHAQLEPKLAPECRRMSRVVFECAIAAPTTDAMVACDPK